MHKDLKNLWLPYTQMKNLSKIPKAIKTAKCKIFTDEGTYLIDGISSWWTACHGYNNSYIQKKIVAQLNTMPHIMFGGLIHDQAIKLSKRLIKLLDNKLKKVFFSDSGSVAVEVALKMSLQYWLNKGYKKKNRFVFFKDGYHGDTAAAMSICDPEEGMHSLFGDYLRKNYMVSIPKTETEKNEFIKFISSNKNTIAGLIIEPLLQGAGGMKFHTPAELEFIYKVTKKFDLLLIYDEVATGFLRTGSMFAFQQTKSQPDILCIGKALTGGFMTLAATISTTEVFNSFLSIKEKKEFMHGPTYMANPLACSAANASLDLFEKRNYKSKVYKIEQNLLIQLNKFKKFSFIKEVRVMGAVGVVEFYSLSPKQIKWMKSQFIKNKVWIRPLKNIIYFMPPFIITKAEVNFLVNVVYNTLLKWKKIE